MLLLEVEAPRTRRGAAALLPSFFLGTLRPTKLAWVRSGMTTAFVATEQLRSAVGFEQCVPAEQDVIALKDASQALTESLWMDESGPSPPEEEMLEAQPLHRVLGEDDFLMDYQSNNELLAAASSQLAGQQRLDAAASWAPGTPVPAPEPPQARRHQQHLRVRSPWRRWARST